MNDKHQSTKNKTDDDKSRTTQLFKLFILLSIYRLANAWMIRTQFDPDEYWQTLEPAYCLAFNNPYSDNVATTQLPLHPQQKYGCALTWEWTRRLKPPLSTLASQDTQSFQKIIRSVKAATEQALHGPVRSYVSILPTYWYYLGCRSLFHWASRSDNNGDGDDSSLIAYTKQFVRQHSTYLISKGPLLLHAMTVAVPIDMSVWIIASRLERLVTNHQCIRSNKVSNSVFHPWWQSWGSWALIFTITSWFNGYALIRTYANSMEAMFLLVGIALLCPELFDVSVASDQRRTRHRLLARLAFVLGGLSACVRFTSLAAWIPIGLIIVLRENASLKQRFGTLFGLCAINGMLGVVLGCSVDRWLFGFWAVPFLGNFHFNVVLGLGTLYGTHPMLWYFYAGVPAICGIMLPMFLWDSLLLLTRATPLTNDTDTKSRLTILWIIGSYTILHSFSKHKEFRFLLPVLPLMCIMAGHAMVELLRGMSSLPNVIIVALCLLNYPHLIYLSIFHQRGPIEANIIMAAIMRNEAQKDKFTVHYLLGCHSAPAYSHLHSSDVSVDVWYLDCSPECRANEAVVCESDAFSNDPYKFMQSAYFALFDGDCKEEERIHSCTNDESTEYAKQAPSFVVIMREDALKVERLLADKLNATRVASIRHSVAALSWHQNQAKHSEYDVLTLFSFIDVRFEHMEIYSTM